MKLLFISYEVAPIYKFGGLGDVAGALPKALVRLGVTVHIGMPAYSSVKKVPYLPKTKIPMHYIGGPEFNDLDIKKKDPRYGSIGFALFARNILKEIKKSGFKPDIIHINDWHTGLIPLLIKKEKDPYFAHTKTLLTIHNSNYQGVFQMKYLLQHPQTKDIGELLGGYGKKFVRYLRVGIEHADMVSTVSPQFREEILEKKFGFGIGGKLRKRKRTFKGIINGIDYVNWDSSSDKHLHANFKKGDFGGKQRNKAHLQKICGLPISDVPLFGMVARMSWQKGFDILIPVLRKIGRMPVQVVILGSGKKGIQDHLKKVAARFENIVVDIEFNEKLAHQIYASSDFFLIPSIFEPCGLTQMISMAYGTIPVAAEVGGLVDTIEDGKTGFLFPRHGEANLLHAINRSVEVYKDKDALGNMQQNCLRQDFSWDQSAKEYLELYKKVQGSS